MKKILLYIAIVATFASCAKDDNSANVLPSEGVATFFAGVMSRVVGTKWESTDEVGIIVLDATANVSDSHPFNARHTVSTAGVFTPYDDANTIYYSIDRTEKIDFCAYYPYAAIDDTELTYSVNLSDQSAPTKIDFMEAYTNDGYNYDSPAVKLTFTRRLTKFTINLSAKDGFVLSDVTAVRFEGFHTTAKYYFATKGFGSLGDIKNITPYKEDSDTYSALLIPMDDGDYALGADHKVVFETSYGDVTWELYDSQNDTDKTIYLKAGSEHSFNVTISRETMDANAKIDSWIEEDKTADSFYTDNN